MGFKLLPGELKERKRIAQLWKELTRGERGTIVGVTRPGGVGGVHSRGQRCYTLQIPLLAWRLNDGPIVERELVVRKRVSEWAVDGMKKRVKDFDVIRIEGRVAEQNVFGSPQAMMDRFVGKSQDPEMVRVARRLAKPVWHVDPQFGRLRFHRGHETFKGRVLWAGRPVSFILECDMGAPLSQALKHARRLFKAEAIWNLRLRAALARFVRHCEIRGEIPLSDPRWRTIEAWQAIQSAIAAFDRLRGDRLELLPSESKQVDAFRMKHLQIGPTGKFSFECCAPRLGLSCLLDGALPATTLEIHPVW